MNIRNTLVIFCLLIIGATPVEAQQIALFDGRIRDTKDSPKHQCLAV